MPDHHERTTILVVEDNLLVRMHGTDILSDAGFEIIEAENADEALAVLGQHSEVGLVFSDIDMPGSMNGLELTRLVHERWPNIRLLLTSGHHQLRDADVPDNGKFVPKPWSHDALLNRVRDALKT